MKALLFTLLLLLIEISPSFTAPTPDTTSLLYRDRQRIIYTIFTPDGGVINIECLWDPSTQSLDLAPYSDAAIERRVEDGTMVRVTINERSVRRWTFNINPGSENIHISAGLQFRPRNPSLHGTLVPGVTIVDPNTVEIRQRTATNQNVRGEGGPNFAPMAVNFVFMTILEQNALSLDSTSERYLGRRGPNYLVWPWPFPNRSRNPVQLPLQLDTGIWIHLLSNRMSEYQPGAIECQPTPENVTPRPSTDETCRVASSRPHNRDDKNDPDAQREKKKRSFLFGDLNKEPLDLNDEPGDQHGSEPAAETGTSTRGKFIFDHPTFHIELQAGITTENVFIYPYEDYEDYQVNPIGFTRKENTSSRTKPGNVICCGVLSGAYNSPRTIPN
jgi:hypothetical protein